jgi:hypothetical protein
VPALGGTATTSLAVQHAGRVPREKDQLNRQIGVGKGPNETAAAGDIVPAAVGPADVTPGILRHPARPASPTLLHLPVGDRIGIGALRDRRVLALVLLTIADGLVVYIDGWQGGPARRRERAVVPRWSGPSVYSASCRES